MADISNVTNLGEYSVVIEGERYSMLEIPKGDSKIVQAERSRVLRNIDLAKLVKCLGRTKDLLYLAYNGVAGFGELTAAMTRLQDKYAVLCGKSEIELGNFAHRSEQIQAKLKLVFSFLVNAKGKLALTFLGQCGAVAAEMAKRAMDLSKAFDALGNDAVDVLAKTQIQQGVEEGRKKDLQDKINDLDAKTAKANVLVEQLGKQKEKLQKLYNEAKENAERAENRGFALALVGAIMKPIGEGLGVFAAMYSGGAAAGAANGLSAKLSNKPPSLPKGAKTKAEAEKDVEDGKEAEAEAAKLSAAKDDAYKKAQAKLDTLTAAVKTQEEKLEAAKGKAEAERDEKKKAELEAAVQTATSELKVAREELAAQKKATETAKTEAETTKKDAEAKKAALAAAAKTLNDAGEAASQLGDDYLAIADNYQKEKAKYLDLLLQKEDLERAALGDIAEFAVRMKNMGTEQQTLDLSINGLFSAIGALKQVAVTLRLASHFWETMAASCESLASNDLQDIVKAFSELPDDDQRAYFTGDDFKTQVVAFFAAWKAIEVVCGEYAKEVNGLMLGVEANFVQNLKREKAIKLANDLGSVVLKEAEEGIATSLAEAEQLKSAANEDGAGRRRAA